MREVVYTLGLSVEMRLCPRSTLLREGEIGGSRLRAEAHALLPPGEPLRFPFLHDQPAAAAAAGGDLSRPHWCLSSRAT